LKSGELVVLFARGPKVIVWLPLEIVSVPDPVRVVAPVCEADTLKDDEPTGLLAVEFTVNVTVREELPWKEIGLATETKYVAPTGNPVTPRLKLDGEPEVLVTVTLNVALPAVPKLSVPVWAPTVTVPRFRAGAAATPDTLPTNATSIAASVINRVPILSRLFESFIVCMLVSLTITDNRRADRSAGR
jgi:hypothetical protein